MGCMSRHEPAELAQAFAVLVGQEVEDERIDLVRAALTIAQTEYPELDFEVYCQRIQALAKRVERSIGDIGDPAQAIRALNQVLFAEEGFRGNTEDYYDPRNSFLNDALYGSRTARGFPAGGRRHARAFPAEALRRGRPRDFD